MLRRILAIAENGHREAVRARILHGLFALAVATAAYSLVVGAYASRSATRVISDIGAASISLYAIAVAIFLSSSSLHRELELKTIFPILARPISRTEYLVGKYLGIVVTIGAFAAANTGVLLVALGTMSERSVASAVAIGFTSVAIALAIGLRMPRARTYLPLFWSLAILVVGWVFASGLPDDRRVLAGSLALTLAEVCVVVAVATVFASFSSPFLTAVFALGVFVVGRSADTLAALPERVFGAAIKAFGVALSKVVPNLMVYVPERPQLTGEAAGMSLGHYVGLAWLQALAWSVLLLAFASLIFRRRDFL